MAILRHLWDALRAWRALCREEEPDVIIAALRLNDSTGFDIITCYDIVKASRLVGVDPKEVADTASAFRMNWMDALKTTIELRESQPH